MEFSNVTVQLYLNINGTNQWVDITDSIVSSNGIQLTPRMDGTFLVGTFDAFLTKEHIPAYTPMKIIYRSNTSYMLCSSTSSKYLLEEGKYYHTFDIFEATAILCNFIVGTKGFSVKGSRRWDFQKNDVLIELMKQKYGLTIDNGLPNLDLTKTREFTFGAGTTLYDALSEILVDYDLVPLVTQITSPTNFRIEDLDKNLTETIEYTDAEKTSVVFRQDMDNYCKFLETETQNVVDRTTTTVWKNLTVRSVDALISADSMCIVLPNKVEEITKITTTSSYNFSNFEIDLYEDDTNNRDLLDYTELYPGGKTGRVNSSFRNIFSRIVDYSYDDDQDYIQEVIESSALYLIMHNIVYQVTGIDYEYLDLCNLLDSMVWVINHADNTDYFKFTSESNIVDDTINVTKYLKEKSEWDVLPNSEKPKYMYYESGSNTIQNLNKRYKDDFWGAISGTAVKAWYEYGSGIEFYCDDNGSSITYETYYSRADTKGRVQVGLSNDYTPLNAIFNVEAKTISDPVIINQKSPTLTPLNESDWKPYARSYNISANTIEFDKLEERMQLTNDMLGDVELEIEMTNPSYLPLITSKKAYKLTYNDVEYYVMAYVINIKLDLVTIKYSLSRTYSKKASVIGVDSQFEATPNPLKNIVTRPIYINASSGINADLEEYNYLKFTFTLTNIPGGTNRTIDLYKRFSVLQNENTKMLYCETKDQYTFDNNMTVLGTGTYVNNPVPYVNEYNEFYSVSVALVKLTPPSNSSVEFSRKLPELYTGTTETTISLATNVKVYKDAREHLTFTIKLN